MKAVPATNRALWMGLANDLYAQVGLVMLVGLLGRNAVLIVESAAQKHMQGISVFGVVIVLGLYFLFGTLAGGKSRIRDEYQTPLTEKVGVHG